MSDPGAKRYRLSNGATATVTAEALPAFTEKVKADGLTFAEVGRAAMAPEPDPTMPAAAAPPSEPDDTGSLGRGALGDLPAKVWGALKEALMGPDADAPINRTPPVPPRYGTGRDPIMRGFTQNVGTGAPDAAIAAGRALSGGTQDYLASKLTGHPGDAGFVRGIERQAAEDSPRGSFAGEALGSVPLAMATGGMGPVAGGGIAGGLRAYGESESDDWGDQAMDVLAGSTVGALTSGAAQAVPASVAGVSRYATNKGGKLLDQSVKQRMFSAGLSAPEVRAMPAPYRARVVDNWRQQGIGGTFKSTAGIADQAEIAQKAGRAAAEPIEQSMAGTSVPPASITTPIVGSRSIYPKGDTGTQPIRTQLTRSIAGVRKMDQTPAGIPYEDVATARKVRGDMVRDFSRQGRARTADAHVYDAYNDAVRAHADTVSPGSGKALADANWNEHTALIALKAADRADVADLSQTPRSLTDRGLGGLGMMPRGADPVSQYATRAALAGAGSWTKGRGHSIASTLSGMRGGAHQGIGGAAQWALDNPLPSTLGQGARMAASGQAGAGFARAARSPEEREATMQAVSNEARGYRIPEATRDMLASNPEVLGPYAQELGEAADQGDAALVSTIIRLQNDTKRGPHFRTTALLELQKLTASRK